MWDSHTSRYISFQQYTTHRITMVVSNKNVGQWTCFSQFKMFYLGIAVLALTLPEFINLVHDMSDELIELYQCISIA